MKKVILVLTSLAILVMMSCRDQKTVVVEKQVETPKTNETTISIDKDGVEFSTKKGDTLTEVIIKD